MRQIRRRTRDRYCQHGRSLAACLTGARQPIATTISTATMAARHAKNRPHTIHLPIKPRQSFSFAASRTSRQGDQGIIGNSTALAAAAQLKHRPLRRYQCNACGSGKYIVQPSAAARARAAACRPVLQATPPPITTSLGTGSGYRLRQFTDQTIDHCGLKRGRRISNTDFIKLQRVAAFRAFHPIQ